MFRVEPVDSRVKRGYLREHARELDAVAESKTANGWTRVRVTVDTSREWLFGVPYRQKSTIQIFIRAWKETGDPETIEVKSMALYCRG